MYNILVCDDDKDIVEAIDIYLSKEGYNIIKAYDGMEAMEILKKEDIQLLLIDVMMPRLDGIRATLKIREKSIIPIIILSAKSEDSDKIIGLDVGADDYITKPFQPPLLLAHIAAVLKRAKKADVTEKMICKGVELDVVRGCVKCQEQQVDLSKNELKILHYLFLHQGEIVPRIELVEYLWDQQVFIDDNALSVNITRLRAKLY